MELDGTSDYMTTAGHFSPSNLILKEGEPIEIPGEGTEEIKRIVQLELFSAKVAVDRFTKHMASQGIYKHENAMLKQEEPITVPWIGDDGFSPTIRHVEAEKCSGIIDRSTFSKFPDAQTVDFAESQLENLEYDSFSLLKKLVAIGFSKSEVKFEKPLEDDAPNRSPLLNFKELQFQLTNVSGLNRDALYDLRFLNKLVFTNCEIHDISSDVFDGLEKITHLEMKTVKIDDFDFSRILQLKSLEYLALHDLDTSSEIDYNIFKALPNLKTILFDTLVYKDLDFDNFSKLKTVEIGVGETKEDKKLHEDGLFGTIMDRIEALQAKGIKSKRVHGGVIHFYMLG